MSLFLENLCIEHYPSPKKRPTYNGKTERHNKEVRFTFKIASQASDPATMISINVRSLCEYDYLRPHHALGGHTPYEQYIGLGGEMKAHIEFVKEQDLFRKAMKQKRTIWIPGMPDPDYVPGKLFIPGNSQNEKKGIIVPIKSKKTRGKTIGYVRQSLHV